MYVVENRARHERLRGRPRRERGAHRGRADVGQVIAGCRPAADAAPGRPTTMNGTVRASSSAPYQLRDLRQQVAADDQRERVLGVQLGRRRTVRRVRLSTAERPLDVADPTRAHRARAAASSHIARRSSNGASGLPNACSKRGHEPELVHGRGLEHVERDQLVRDVGRVEAPAEERDPHRVVSRTPAAAPGGAARRTRARTATNVASSSAKAAPASIARAHLGAAGQQIDRRRIGDELVRLGPPAEVVGRRAGAPPR